MSSSPYINRFLQPDTLIPDPTNPQAFNRYSYVGNNPIMRNDPTGHMMCALECDGGGGIIESPSDDDGGTGEPDGEDEGAIDWIIDRYMLGWENAGQAWSIVSNPNVSLGQSLGASTYLTGWVGFGHVGGSIGGGILLWEGVPAAGWKALEICSRSDICLKAAKAIGVYYPTNNGFVGDTRYRSLPQDTLIYRYGDTSGKYIAPYASTPGKIALPPDKWNIAPDIYKVTSPWGIGVHEGEVASYYGLEGGGIQYVLDTTLQWYINAKYIAPVP